MRGWLALGALAALLGAAQAAERRELGAHEHGHSKLNLAVEGRQVVMEIAAPGLDILGFEHPAESAGDKAAVEAGKAALADPLRLFVMPAAAGCRVVEAAVLLEQEEHEHEADEPEGEAHAAADHGAELHSEFAGRYTLDCADPGALSEITFAWFDRFPNAKEVEVTLVTAKGQTSLEAKRGDPPLAIGTAS
jgi:ssDNA-binding Zn-finger/Zn-ribbon topoisomerase 1